MSSEGITVRGIAAARVAAEAPRRRLSARQEATLQRLVDAAVEEARGSGYEGLSVRNVARRAGVAPATAYTYFASKDHLLAEVFWRRLLALPETKANARHTPAARVMAAVRELLGLVGDEPELASAYTTAVLSSEPDVRHLRVRIGAEIYRRLRDALGPDADPGVLRVLDLSLSGALLQAGMGHLSYEDLPERLAEVVELTLGRQR